MKIMIFGDSASGKSTFAQKLGIAWDLPVFHLDEAMETIGRENKSEIEEFIKSKAKEDCWVIDGNAFTKDLNYRIEKADKIFIFKSCSFITFLRHIVRFIKITYGPHERVGSSDESLNLMYFIEYIFVGFPRRRRAAIKRARALGKDITFFRSYKEANSFLLKNMML